MNCILMSKKCLLVSLLLLIFFYFFLFYSRFSRVYPIFLGNLSRLNIASQIPLIEKKSYPYHQFCKQNPNFFGETFFKEFFSTYKSLEAIQLVEKGGVWKPTNCSSIQKVAIVIPFRNRSENFRNFLSYCHCFLQTQKVEYRVLVVEQAGKAEFNRGMLLNIGFKEALELEPFHCFIFHDVDLLPENDQNYYFCSKNPRHLAARMSTFNYKLPYNGFFGGVTSFFKEQFEKINGFSNLYFGWGAEDDDLYKRVKKEKMEIDRLDSSVSNYKMLSHKKGNPSPHRFDFLNLWEKRYKKDGLNSLEYERVALDEEALFTRVFVNLDRFYIKIMLQANKVPSFTLESLPTTSSLPLVKKNLQYLNLTTRTPQKNFDKKNNQN